MNAYTIELPAGLVILSCGSGLPELSVGVRQVDEGESVGTAALRELKEECGYVGVVQRESPAMPLSPGMTNESVCLVHVAVDLSAPENQQPKQQLDEGEQITVPVSYTHLRAHET